MNIWGRMLELAGWSVDITVPRRDRCVICVAPHTSNWDFILGLLAYRSLGRKANFLMKEFWFFFPLGYLLKSLGGIPVSRKGSGGALTSRMIRLFGTKDYINLAVTPEGTRSAVTQWHTGFLRIAYGAKVPLQLGIIDYAHKRVTIGSELHLTGNIESDLDSVKKYYAQHRDAARYPDKFIF